MTKEQAIAIIEEKRTWADLISGEKDELYDAIDVVLAEIASLRTRLEAIERAGKAVTSRAVPIEFQENIVMYNVDAPVIDDFIALLTKGATDDPA